MIRTHIDLFSGIGGFALSCRWAGIETEVFCEQDKFCQRIIKKHWPGVPIVSDIRDFDGTAYAGVFILTGGFPCQPFSCAGKQRGDKDDRFLWPEMLKVIAAARPRWVLAENVPGIVKMELDNVLSDLEGEGYATGTLIIPACAKNAPHRRDRVWIVANRTSKSRQQVGGRESIKGWTSNQSSQSDSHAADTGCFRPSKPGKSTVGGQQLYSHASHSDNRHEPSRGIGAQGEFETNGNRETTQSRPSHTMYAPHSSQRQNDNRNTRGMGEETEGRESGNPAVGTGNQHAATKKQGLEGRITTRASSSFRWDTEYPIGNKWDNKAEPWDEPWVEAATRLCRMDARISHRVDRLRALGNAIVPQIAYEIIRAILEVECKKSA